MERRWWQLALEYLTGVRPRVTQALIPIRAAAESIPDPALRQAALSSIDTKRFHCEGGAVLAGPSRDASGRSFDFLIPYQTLCDYLDTLTDRGPSKDPENLRQLHQALFDAVQPAAPDHDYYRHHPHRQDGGYARWLVRLCQRSLGEIEGYERLAMPWMLDLVDRYVCLQVAKHGPPDSRVPALRALFARHRGDHLGLFWWEFAAACGSTLPMFAVLAKLASQPAASEVELERLVRLYHPWIGGLHILLDYLVDGEEDRQHGDLNFVAYYADAGQARERLSWLYRRCLEEAAGYPDARFHQYVATGLLAFYLCDRKLGFPPPPMVRGLLAQGGLGAAILWILSGLSRSR